MSSFRTPFDSQYVKEPEKVLKSARQKFYLITSLPCKKLSWKMSLLLLSEILGLFVNKLTVDDTHSCYNTENLPLPFQMQLSKKSYFFPIFLLHF